MVKHSVFENVVFLSTVLVKVLKQELHSVESHHYTDINPAPINDSLFFSAREVSLMERHHLIKTRSGKSALHVVRELVRAS